MNNQGLITELLAANPKGLVGVCVCVWCGVVVRECGPAHSNV